MLLWIKKKKKNKNIALGLTKYGKFESHVYHMYNEETCVPNLDL